VSAPGYARRSEFGPAGVRTAAIVLALGASAVIVGLGVGWALRAGPSSPAAAALGTSRAPGGLRGEATWAPGARPAPPIAGLRDQHGSAFSLAALRGHTVVLAFMDSHCHSACPLEGRTFAAAESALPVHARPVLVVVSVNPRDTPASARAAARAWGLAAAGRWHWLMGTPRQLAAAWRAYHISVVPTPGDITHTEAIYLLDRRGDERSAYLFPFAPRFVGHDLSALASGV
jgi:cytochrome oxidase Cu insertion factor (SCO1/SenC/PrrC family)